MKAMAGFGVSPSPPTVATLADGRTRCSWVTGTGMDLSGYHDDEWGTVTRDVRSLSEALCLTYFENGLSWATVYRWPTARSSATAARSKPPSTTPGSWGLDRRGLI